MLIRGQKDGEIGLVGSGFAEAGRPLSEAGLQQCAASLLGGLGHGDLKLAKAAALAQACRHGVKFSSWISAPLAPTFTWVTLA